MKPRTKIERRFADLAGICESGGGLWSAEAEKYLLEHWS